MTIQHQRVTIHDVARVSKVSVSTVSKVVNRRDGIARGTRERVQAVIDELGYGASVGARGMRSERTGVLGILLNEFEPYATEVIKGIAEASEGSGFELLAWSASVGGSRTPKGWEQQLIARLAGSLIDGAVLITPSATRVNAPGFPLVAVDPHDSSGPIPSVHADDFGGAALAVDHLVSLGHRRIGFLGGRPDLVSAEARERGFRETMAKHGLEVDEKLVVRGDYTPSGAEQPARDLLTAQHRPTAIFAANDMSALAVIEVADEYGLSVPGDVSVIGFDNVPESVMSTPTLTTISQPLHQIGQQAMLLLLEQLNGQDRGEIRQKVPTHLVVRDSTAAPGHS